jgi:hypothetical protein
MKDRFFEIYETDNPLAIKYIKGVKFEIDPNLDYAVRTKDNIPSSTIIGKPIDFNILEKYNELIKNFFK